MNMNEIILPERFTTEIANTRNYPQEFYSPSDSYLLTEWDGMCDNCRYTHLKNFGFFCPCCPSLYGSYDTAGKPPFIEDGIYEYFYKPSPNTIYYSEDNVYLGDRGANNGVYYNPTYKGPLFITGESCTLNNKTGINLFLPEKKFTEEQAVKFQEIINFLTSPSI